MRSNSNYSRKDFFENYGGILLLLAGISLGSILGLIFKKDILFLKPIGDIFLNLLFTAVIPLVFFAISSAIAAVDKNKSFGKLVSTMSLVFLATILISAFLTIVATWIFPIQKVDAGAQAIHEQLSTTDPGEQLTKLVSVEEFFQLLSRKSMLALIIFSIMIGLAVARTGEKAEPFKRFLISGNEVMISLLAVIMKWAPIGLGCYFAYQVGVFGPQLFGTYAQSLAIYYGFGIFYFFVFFSFYAFVAGGLAGIKKYWQNNILASATAVGTCSSIATIPANLSAARKMNIPEDISDLVVPLGASLHKDGSSISSIIKIGVAFAILNKDITGVETVLLALAITVIVSIVEGGIPNGGYVGELLMISAYNFPLEVLPAVMIIGTLVDPLATLLNATGDTVAGMLVARFTKGKHWPTIREN